MKLIINDIPPSNNKFMSNDLVKNRANICQDVKNNGQNAEYRLAVGRNKPKTAIEKVTYYFPNRIRRDTDNYSGKLINDDLVKAVVLKDDSFSNIRLVLKGDYDKDNLRT